MSIEVIGQPTGHLPFSGIDPPESSERIIMGPDVVVISTDDTVDTATDTPDVATPTAVEAAVTAAVTATLSAAAAADAAESEQDAEQSANSAELSEELSAGNAARAEQAALSAEISLAQVMSAIDELPSRIASALTPTVDEDIADEIPVGPVVETEPVSGNWLTRTWFK